MQCAQKMGQALRYNQTGAAKRPYHKTVQWQARRRFSLTMVDNERATTSQAAQKRYKAERTGRKKVRGGWGTLRDLDLVCQGPEARGRAWTSRGTVRAEKDPSSNGQRLFSLRRFAAACAGTRSPSGRSS